MASKKVLDRNRKGICLRSDVGSEGILCGNRLPCARHAPANIAAKEKEIHRPTHYTSHPSGVECIDITEHMRFNIGSAVKYLWRADLKHATPLMDLKKARWYIDREIQRLERSPSTVFASMAETIGKGFQEGTKAFDEKAATFNFQPQIPFRPTRMIIPESIIDSIEKALKPKKRKKAKRTKARKK